MKSTLAIVALLASSFAVAQEQTFTFSGLQVGDSVMIRKSEVTHYLTGEEPSTWVYGKKFAVMQLGTKRFPEGVLLKPIISWIDADLLYLPGEEAQETAETTPAKQKQGVAKGGEENTQEGEPTEGTQEEGTTPQEGEAVQEGTPQEGETTPEEQTEGVQEDHSDTEPGEVQKADGVKYVSDEPEMKIKNPQTPAYHRFSIGVRGGVASLMHNNEEEMGNWKLGFDALLDLQYAYYFSHRQDKNISHGIITGLSVGYSRSPISNDINTDYEVTGDAGETIKYHIEADKVSEKDGQIQLEVPLMYSMLMDNGFFLNIGPKFMMPVYTHYNQTLTNPHVSAYFEDMGVTVKDEVITGYVDDGDLTTRGQWGKAKTKISIMVTAELGYEWKLKNGNSLGLGVYANYAPWNSFKNDTENTSLIDVTPPSGSTPAGAADILSATDTYTKGMNYFDGGLKLVYHFNFPVYK